MNSVTRPVLRWHGGKWRLAPWIISNFPAHRIYVEPFGGAGSVLMRKEPCYAEVYNDLDGMVVNLFRVLRDPLRAVELRRQLELTPYARDEFDQAYEPMMPCFENDIERARRLVVMCFMGFGSNAHVTTAPRTGFRANSNRSGSTPAHDWTNWPAAVPAMVERLRGVVIENKDAMAVMHQHDGPETLHYVDPPYLHSTRAMKAGRPDKRGYAFELGDAEHEALLDGLMGLVGMVVLSGYANPLYDAKLAGWRRIEKPTIADGGRARTEVLWINPQAVAGGSGK